MPTPATLSSSNTNAMDEPQPIVDLPLQNGYCVLCRFPVWVGDHVAAVVGDWASTHLSAYTFGFTFPSQELLYTWIKVHGKSRSYSCRICRHPSCGECRHQAGDTFVYHVDCYHLVSRQIKPLTLQDIWTIGTWTQALPNTRYQAWPACRSSFVDDPVAGLDCLTSSLRGIPRELCQIIIDYSQEAPLWRLLSACHRVRTLSSLLSPSSKRIELPFTSVKSWDRERGIAKDESNSFHVRLCIDDLGIKSLKQLPEGSTSYAKKAIGESWYITEELQDLDDSRVQFQGAFARIISPKTWKLWDIPNPPTTDLSWFAPEYIPDIVGSIKLEGLTGLTAFCCQGQAFCVRPHYEHSESAPFPQQTAVDPSEMPKFTEIFFPMSRGEKIKALWVRYMDLNPGRYSPVLAIETNLGRVRVLGGTNYHPHAEITFRHLGSDPISHILLSETEPAFPMYNYCAAPSPIGESPQLPDKLLRHNPPDGGRFIYLSVASLRNIRQVRLFHLDARGPRQPRICVGMLLEYIDGNREALGICHGRHDGEDVIASPKAIYYKYTPTGLIAGCSSLPTKAHVAGGLDWKTKVMEGEIKWWFNDDDEVLIE